MSSSARTSTGWCIDVETKPSITPRDAIASAGKTLTELFGLARELNVEAEGIDIGPSPVEAEQHGPGPSPSPIEDLNLTVRSYNCLKREGIHTVGELDLALGGRTCSTSATSVQKSIDEVKIKLHGLGLSLKDSPAGFDPAAAAQAYGDADWSDTDDDFSAPTVIPDEGTNFGAPSEVADDTDYAETEQI